MPVTPPAFAALFFTLGAILPFAVVLVCAVVGLIKR
jgi:hypothetical protein